MNIFRTYLVRKDQQAVALAITDALGYPEKGMLIVPVEDAGDDIAYISSGIVDDDSPLHGTAAELLAALDARNPEHTITLADCELFTGEVDLTDAEPFGQMDMIRAEVTASADPSAYPEWEQPQGTVGMYDRDAIVRHAGTVWKSLLPFNVWEPGTSGWRLLWSAGDDGPVAPPMKKHCSTAI